jgi:hypothetical protein
MIPKLAHFIWLNETPPKWVLDNVKIFKAKHPDWKVIIWKDQPKNLPQMLGRLLLELPFLASRADVLRYWILARYGGVYLDCDTVTLRNFNPLLEHDFFIARHGSPAKIVGSVIGTLPNTEHILRIVQAARERATYAEARGRKSFGQDLLMQLFSPAAIASRLRFDPHWHPPKTLPTHYFCPIPDSSAAVTFWRGDAETRAGILTALESKQTDETPPYSVHCWGIDNSHTKKSGFLSYTEAADDI